MGEPAEGVTSAPAVELALNVLVSPTGMLVEEGAIAAAGALADGIGFVLSADALLARYDGIIGAALAELDETRIGVL